MKFKVGEKAKFVQCMTLNPRLWGKICTVIEVRDDTYQFPYKVGYDKVGRLPVMTLEIEKVNTEGQLLFSFMTKEF